jgi:hypothetical protein
MLFILTAVLIRHLWQLKTVVSMHWCLIRAVPLSPVTITSELLESDCDQNQNDEYKFEMNEQQFDAIRLK